MRDGVPVAADGGVRPVERSSRSSRGGPSLDATKFPTHPPLRGAGGGHPVVLAGT